MTIQGGGKLPPNAGHAGGAERPRRAAEKRQAREAGSEPAAAPRTEKPARDVFETSFRSIPTPAQGLNLAALQAAAGGTAGQRVDEILNNPSQIRQMAEAISAHARKLGTEFDALRGTAQGMVGELAKAGFSSEAVAARREELGDIRRQMAGLRGKIASDGRRLKLLKAAAHRLGESKLTEKVSTQLKRIADMERGWGRAFLALGIAGTFSTPDGEARPGRVSLSQAGNADRHQLGSYVAAQSPGTASSQLLVALLEDGPHAPSGRLIADAYAELHQDVLAGRMGKSLQGLGLWRQALG